MKITTKRFLSVLLTVFMIFGTVAMMIPATVITASADDDYVEITPNTNFVYNGITYRFDVNSANPQDGTTYARINPDGTIDVRLRHGDMLWFPDLQMTSSTTIHAEVTALVNMTKRSSGLAYAVRPDESGKWENAMIADVRNDGRVRIAAVSYTGLGTVSGSDYGNGGDYKVWAPNRGQGDDVMDAIITTDAHKAIELGSTDGGASLYDWAKEKPPVSFDVSNSDGTVTVEWGVPDIGSFAEYSYETASNASLSYTGSVGYTHDWANSSWQVLKVRIERLTVTNCTVGGNATAVWNAVGISDEAISTSLNGTIGLNFKFQAAPYVASNAHLVVTKAGNEILDAAVSGLWSNGEAAYVCSVPVFAKEMTDEVNFSIKIGGEVFKEYSYTVTVKQYAEALAAADAEWADLMNAMLDYGAAAQELFDYNTSNLAADISGGITYDASSVPSLSADVAYNAFIGVVAGTLTLESGTDLNLYVLPVDGEATFTATAVDSNSVSVPVTVAKSGDYWRITISDLKAEELGDQFHITVSDGVNSVTFTYSALCWVKAAINDANASANTKTLAKAIGVYTSEAQKKTVSP